MSGISKKLMGTTAAGGEALAIEDVFSTYLYTGTGTAFNINNGVNLLDEGGMLWTKSRNNAGIGHYIIDTNRGLAQTLRVDSTGASINFTTKIADAWLSDGYTVGTSSGSNNSGDTFASWTFRKAPRFFDVVTYTGDGTGIRMIDHSLGIIPGAIVVKRIDSTSNWFLSHRGFNSGIGQGFLNLTNAFTTSTASDVQQGNSTDTQFYVRDGANTSGATYVAYLFAHDPLGPSGDGSDGLIACGSYTGDGTTDGSNQVTLGWEPQWLLIKNTTSADNWVIMDNMRGLVNGGGAVGADKQLNPNTTGAETGFDFAHPTATGFALTSSSGNVNQSSQTYIYIAIRRGPMRQPESGTEVFAVDNLPSSVSQNQAVLTSGFPVDANIRLVRSGGAGQFINSRMTGSYFLVSSSTGAELGGSSPATWGWDSNTGIIKRDTGTNNYTNQTAYSFRRAPGFFDVVAYESTGTVGQTFNHNLGAVPEMMIFKNRDNSYNWIVYHKDTGASQNLVLNSTAVAVASSQFNSTAPTDTVFTLGGQDETNGYTQQSYIAYLFATLPGVSKVGSYTGNSGTQTIDCGFTTGARFVMVKAASTTGAWFVWDTARGIVSGTEPYLRLNSSVAEENGYDAIDPDSSGFTLNNVGTGTNDSGTTYIFLAIA